MKMNTVLFVALAVYSALGTNVPQYLIKCNAIFNACAEREGLSTHDLKELWAKSADWPLTAKEQNFVCCISITLMSNKSVNVRRVQEMINTSQPGKKLDLAGAMKECSSTGLNPNHLATDYQISTFFRCLFGKLKEPIPTNNSNFDCII